MSRSNPKKSKTTTTVASTVVTQENLHVESHNLFDFVWDFPRLVKKKGLFKAPMLGYGVESRGWEFVWGSELLRRSEDGQLGVEATAAEGRGTALPLPPLGEAFESFGGFSWWALLLGLFVLKCYTDQGVHRHLYWKERSLVIPLVCLRRWQSLHAAKPCRTFGEAKRSGWRRPWSGMAMISTRRLDTAQSEYFRPVRRFSDFCIASQRLNTGVFCAICPIIWASLWIKIQDWYRKIAHCPRATSKDHQHYKATIEPSQPIRKKQSWKIDNVCIILKYTKLWICLDSLDLPR